MLLAQVTIEQIGAVFAGLAMLLTVYFTWKAKQTAMETKETVVADAIVKDEKLQEIGFKVDGRLTEALNYAKDLKIETQSLKSQLKDQALILEELRERVGEVRETVKNGNGTKPDAAAMDVAIEVDERTKAIPTVPPGKPPDRPGEGTA